MNIISEFLKIVFTLLGIVYIIIATAQYFFGLSGIVTKVIHLII